MNYYVRMCVFALMVVVAGMASPSQAALIVSIDFDTATPGIQSTNATPVTVGSSITANLFMDMTAPTTLGIYTYSVSFGNGLSLTGRTESAFGTLVPSDNTNPINNATGRAFRFDGSDFGVGRTDPLGAFIGTLTFQVLGETNTQILPGLFDPESTGGADSFYNAAGLDITNTVGFIGGSVNVTAVPEPSTVLVLGTVAGLVCAGRAWKRRKLSNAKSL
jgi:hypothetical protein